MTPTLTHVPLSETAWQGRVMDFARLRGWRITHFRPTQVRPGRWATALAGDPGWPDLALCRDGRLILAELKTERGRLSPGQVAWLGVLQTVQGVDVRVWRPSDWDSVMEALR